MQNDHPEVAILDNSIHLSTKENYSMKFTAHEVIALASENALLGIITAYAVLASVGVVR